MSNPGIAQYEASAKPTERALAGTARDSEANSPGTSSARQPLRRILARTAAQTVGAKAKAKAKTPLRIATPRRKRKIRLGSRRNSRIPTAAPMPKPTSWNGSTNAAR